MKLINAMLLLYALGAASSLALATEAGLETQLAQSVARGAREACRASVAGAADIDVLVVARDGGVLAHVGP